MFFPHGIGHLLGLQVHDVGGVMGDLAGGERERPEGHPVLAPDPHARAGRGGDGRAGDLFDRLAAARPRTPMQRRAHIDWSVVEELKPFGGIRIEDNVATTASKPENMTRDAFARLAA